MSPEKRNRDPLDRLPLWKTVLFSLIPLLVLALFAEATIRIYRGELLSTESQRAWRLTLLKSGYPTEYDPQLGYIPRPNYVGADNVWATSLTIDESGLRRNGRPAPDGPGAILALGDSFTFGDEVSDHETWPAQLEQILGKRVLNAGVFGYGVGQSVLRLEKLLPIHQPDTVVLAIVPDDVHRAEMSSRFAWKPYFDVNDGSLALHNVPVPTEYRSQTVKTILGYSHSLDWILARVAPAWWLVSSETIRAHERGPAVAALLIDRVHELQAAEGFELLVVILDEGRVESGIELVQPMMQRASEIGIEVLNLIPELREIESNPDIRARYRAPKNHMSPEGNRWVAAQIAARLEALQNDTGY